MHWNIYFSCLSHAHFSPSNDLLSYFWFLHHWPTHRPDRQQRFFHHHYIKLPLKCRDMICSALFSILSYFYWFYTVLIISFCHFLLLSTTSKLNYLQPFYLGFINRTLVSLSILLPTAVHSSDSFNRGFCDFSKNIYVYAPQCRHSPTTTQNNWVVDLMLFVAFIKFIFIYNIYPALFPRTILQKGSLASL